MYTFVKVTKKILNYEFMKKNLLTAAYTFYINMVFPGIPQKRSAVSPVLQKTPSKAFGAGL